MSEKLLALIPLLVSRKTASEVTGLSIRSIDYLLIRQELIAKKCGLRTMITRASLEKLCRSNRSVGITTPSPEGAERE